MTDTRKEYPAQGSPDACTLFEKILSGQAPASFVYRDDVCAAFMDIRPINPGHVLVVPLESTASLEDLDEDTAAHLLRIGHRIARAIRQSDLRCEGINLFLADGEVAGQEIFHVHLHVFPRFTDDGFGLRHSESNLRFRSRVELDDHARRIADALD